MSGLEPKHPYVLALAEKPDGTGALEPLQSFTTNPAGAAIVNAIGPIRQLVESGGNAQRRYLVIVPAGGAQPAAPAQVQVLLTNGRPPSIDGFATRADGLLSKLPFDLRR